MTIRKRIVAVNQLPEISNRKEGRLFLHEIRNWMSVDRPRMVLDCSHLRHMDASIVYLLLCCLEEAMKRNGDVKLAALPPGSRTVLEDAGANRLFDIYDTTAEAVNSFHQLPVHDSVKVPREPENVA